MSPGSWCPWQCVFCVLALCAALTSCRPAVPATSPERAIPAATVVNEAKPDPQQHDAVVPAQPESATQSPRVITWSTHGVSFEGVAFDARRHRLVVVDQAGGPGSQFASAGQAARSVGGIAAVNAGFFTPGGEPLGLVVSRGKPAGHWNGGSSLGTGVWHETVDGSARIARREAIGAVTAQRMRELLQSGPMLVEHGEVVKGLRGGESRPRTLIAWDGHHRWWIGCSAPCSMPDLAAALANGGGLGFSVRTALNLDGGRSSELWVGGDVAEGPLTRRPMWNRVVRNHLVLVRR